MSKKMREFLRTEIKTYSEVNKTFKSLCKQIDNIVIKSQLQRFISINRMVLSYLHYVLKIYDKPFLPYKNCSNVNPLSIGNDILQKQLDPIFSVVYEDSLDYNEIKIKLFFNRDEFLDYTKLEEHNNSSFDSDVSITASKCREDLILVVFVNEIYTKYSYSTALLESLKVIMNKNNRLGIIANKEYGSVDAMADVLLNKIEEAVNE